MKEVIESVWKLRESKAVNINLRKPLTSVTVLTANQSVIDQVALVTKYVEQECNVGEVIFDTNVGKFTML